MIDAPCDSNSKYEHDSDYVNESDHVHWTTCVYENEIAYIY